MPDQAGVIAPLIKEKREAVRHLLALCFKIPGCRKNRHGQSHEGLSSFPNKCGEDEQAFHFAVP